MTEVKFINGSMTTDDFNKLCFLLFSSNNAGSKKYIKMLNALPKINGLKRQDKRMKFVIDLIHNLEK